jgi:AraC family transcriptional regulator, positive regulator of tynA and feaB
MGGPSRGSTAERTWTTASLPEPERFPFWRDMVSGAFVPVSPTRLTEGPFAGRVTARTVGGLGVSRIASQAQSVERSSGHIERRAGDVFFLNLPLSAGTLATQNGRTASLRSGDFVVVDSTRPFELRFEQEFQQISFTLPHDSLAPLLAAPWDATAVRIPGDRGVGAVASGALRALANTSRPFDRHAGRALTSQLAGLVALALGGVQVPPASTSRALLLQAALDETERALDDPELSPAHVSERLGISIRYLHRLFADRGPSFGRWVLTRRLERCHRDLADPARGHWTIGDVACHHGFGDPSYFARAFKARYGMSPREFRRMCAEQPA